MNQETLPTPEELENRFRGMVDIVYLSYAVWLYVASILYPLFGIIMGVILMYASIHPQAKKIGRICLILGIINIIVVVVLLIIFGLALGGFFTGTRGSYY